MNEPQPRPIHDIVWLRFGKKSNKFVVNIVRHCIVLLELRLYMPTAIAGSLSIVDAPP